MRNYIQPGERMEYANAGSAIAAGDVVVLGERIGVALVDIAATSGSGTIELEGVFELASVTNAAFAQGDALMWDSSTGKLTKVASSTTTPAGVCFEAKLSAGAVARVNLDPNPRRSAAVADIGTADGSDPTTTQALANASKVKINAILAALRAAGLMKT